MKNNFMIYFSCLHVNFDKIATAFRRVKTESAIKI